MSTAWRAHLQQVASCGFAWVTMTKAWQSVYMYEICIALTIVDAIELRWQFS